MTADALAPSVLIATLTKIFKPSAPTDDEQLFRGRLAQLDSVVTATQEDGQHAMVFGERGVGKTSLAYMAMAVFRQGSPGSLTVRMACTAGDDFGSVWQKLVPRLRQVVDTREEEERRMLADPIDRVEDLFMDTPTPEIVSRALNLLASKVPMLVVIDEFDRIDGYTHSDAFADLVKLLSDDLIQSTLIIVGVADDVSGLLAGHASIDRSLRQVAMPRMTEAELTEVVVKGFQAFTERSGHSLTVDDDAVGAIANMSQGFPYYTHLLASSVGKDAIHASKSAISFDDVFTALIRAKDDAEPSIKENYHQATLAARSDATFKQTLLACALAPTDHLGYFAASDVREPLERIIGSPRPTSSFNAHLKRFSQESPFVLESQPVKNSQRYRFQNPLMRPFVLMQGFSTGALSPSLLTAEVSNDARS
ncbi:MAG: AAA family ATPase [Ornithinimicrobium sp.]